MVTSSPSSPPGECRLQLGFLVRWGDVKHIYDSPIYHALLLCGQFIFGHQREHHCDGGIPWSPMDVQWCCTQARPRPHHGDHIIGGEDWEGGFLSVFTLFCYIAYFTNTSPHTNIWSYNTGYLLYNIYIYISLIKHAPYHKVTFILICIGFMIYYLYPNIPFDYI